MNKKIKIGSLLIDVKSLLIGAVAVAVASALPMVGDYVTKGFNQVRGMVSGLFNKGGQK